MGKLRGRTKSGQVLVSGLYALCCKILGRSCLVYVLPGEKRPLVERYFGRDYGRFSYEHLPRTTYAQSLAQMMRLRPAKDRQTGERTATRRARAARMSICCCPGCGTWPATACPNAPRILDFGAGQMDYVKRLQASGRHRRGVPRRGHRRRGVLFAGSGLHLSTRRQRTRTM